MYLLVFYDMKYLSLIDFQVKINNFLNFFLRPVIYGAKKYNFYFYCVLVFLVLLYIFAEEKQNRNMSIFIKKSDIESY